MKDEEWNDCPYCKNYISKEKGFYLDLIAEDLSPCHCFTADMLLERDKEILRLKAKIVELESWQEGLLSMKERKGGVY